VAQIALVRGVGVACGTKAIGTGVKLLNVNLGPAFDQFVAEHVRLGFYQSQSEIVREGLRLLMEREQLKELRLNQLCRSR
jgi:putative addiction module CopG family antidote